MSEPTPIERAAAEACNCGHPPGEFYDVRAHAACIDDARAALTPALGSVEETARYLYSRSPLTYADEAAETVHLKPWEWLTEMYQDHMHAEAEALHAWLLREPETKEAGRG